MAVVTTFHRQVALAFSANTAYMEALQRAQNAPTPENLQRVSEAFRLLSTRQKDLEFYTKP